MWAELWDTWAQARSLQLATFITFGLILGSFLNVVAFRLPLRVAWGWRQEAREVLELPDVADPAPRGLVHEPSACPHCGHRLSWWENIPVLSYLMLRGRCRGCRAPISAQYPLVEALTGALCGVLLWHLGPSGMAVAGVVLTGFLVGLALIDLRTMYLLDALTLPLLWAGLGLSLAGLTLPLEQAVLGAMLGYGVLWLVFWGVKLVLRKDGLGFGDLKLVAALGAFCGPWALLPILFTAAVAMIVVFMLARLVRKGAGGQELPFGPALAIAGWVQFVFGDVFAPAMRAWGLGG